MATLPVLNPVAGGFEAARERTNLGRQQFFYWLSHKLRPHEPLLNAVSTFTIRGPVDRHIFSAAHERLIQLSDALRTVILEKDGLPQRVVRPEWESALAWVDFSGQAEPENSLADWLQARSSKIFELEKQLFDSVLIRLADDHFVWYFSQHHINTDAASAFLIWRYLSEAYEAIQNAEPADRSRIAPYEAYLDYENRQSRSAGTEKIAEFWSSLDDIRLEKLKFFGRRAMKSGVRVQNHSFALDSDRSQALLQIAARKGVFAVSREYTCNVLFMALLAVLVHEHTGARRIGMLSPTHNRQHPQFRDTVGLLMGFLPVFFTIEPGDRFMDVFRAGRKYLRKILADPGAGLEMALGKSGFEVMYNFYTVPIMALGESPVVYRRIHHGFGTESLAAHVNLVQPDEAFEVRLDLHKEVFSRKEAQEIATAYRQLVDRFLAEPDFPIGSPPPEPVRPGSHPAPLDRFQSSEAYLPPRDPIENHLAYIWEGILKVSPVGVRDTFQSLGGDSLKATRLLFSIREEMNVNLPLTSLIEADTVEKQAELLRLDKPDDLWSEVVVLKKAPPDGPTPFFCVPGGGGNLMAFSRLASVLRSPNAFLAFEQQAFRNIAAATPDSVEETAQAYLQVMKKVQPAGPYLLGGYSWGAIIALEIAQQLAAASEHVPILVIIDMPVQHPSIGSLQKLLQGAGSLLKREPERARQAFAWLRSVLFAYDYFWRTGANLVTGRVHPRRETFARLKGGLLGLLQSLRPPAWGETAKGVDFWSRFDLDDLRLRVIRQNEGMLNDYVARPYAGDVALLMTRFVRLNPRMRSAKEKLGWEHLVTGNLQVYEVPGDHLSILKHPNVQTLAGHLDKILETENQKLEKTTQQE